MYIAAVHGNIIAVQYGAGDNLIDFFFFFFFFVGYSIHRWFCLNEITGKYKADFFDGTQLYIFSFFCTF